MVESFSMKASVIRAVALIVAGGAVLVAWMQQAQPLKLERIADDLHVIVGSGGNVAVLTTNEGAILVDDKYEPNVPEILEKVRSLTDKPIRWVLNTHQHGDHTGGNRKLIEANANVVAHRNARANMVKENMPGLPHVTFNDQTAVHLGGKEVRAYYLGRGHTNGDVVIVFPQHRVIHMGDMFNTASPFVDYSAGGSAVAWTQTIDEALKLDFDTVIPGHGPISRREDLVKWKKTFEAVRSRISELKRQGRSKEDLAKTFKLEDFGWVTGRFGERTLPGLYDEVR